MSLPDERVIQHEMMNVVLSVSWLKDRLLCKRWDVLYIDVLKCPTSEVSPVAILLPTVEDRKALMCFHRKRKCSGPLRPTARTGYNSFLFLSVNRKWT